MSSPAFAQLAPPPPVRQSVDGNGVDLFLGTFNVTGPVISIGSAEPEGLSYYKINRGSGWTDNLIAVINITDTSATVTFNGVSDSFTLSGSTYIPTEANGASLTFDGTSVYTYTGRDGTVAHFDKTRLGTYPFFATGGRVTDIVKPDGEKLTFSYTSLYYCSASKLLGNGEICTAHSYAYRVASVHNSYGYQASVSYSDADPIQPDDIDPDLVTWATPTGVSLSNLAAPAGSGSVHSDGFTDGLGRRTTFRMSGAKVAGVTLPGSSSEDVTVAYDGTSGRVSSITTPAGVTGYNSTDLNGVRTVTVTDPLQHVTTYRFDIVSERMTSITDANLNTTSMAYDASGRLSKVTQPEGNYTQLTYDSRGNVTDEVIAPKSGTGTIALHAGYDATCTNPVTCNEPNWTKDANGNETDYTYDPSHGGVLTVTRPAPAAEAVRPQTRYTYTALQAYYNTGSGIVASGQTLYRLKTISECQVNATCAGTADEVKTTIDYGPQTTGVGNNLLPVSVTKAAGDGSLSATVGYSYDDAGNRTAVDGPLAGASDTTAYRYNADRELVGSIGPAPDGSHPNRAERITIDADSGLKTKVESGTTSGQTDAAWNAFSSAETVDIGYDSSRRIETEKLSAGGTAYALSQISYDADGRQQCVAVRMNPAGSVPASACTQTSGNNDRITKVLYDPAGQATDQIIGVGVSGLTATERHLTYTANGKLASLEDANSHTTSYSYDAYDRPSKTTYPDGTYEEALVYDDNGNITQQRNRAAQVTNLTYDHLNRLTLKDLPGTEPDVSYGYDNLGRLKSASQTGNALSFTYDALGRNLTQTGPQGTVASEWDVAGRRIKLTYPGTGLLVNYDYLVTGEISKIRENSASSGVGVLASYAYDALGTRTSVTFGNGSVESYAYDPVSRLKTLTNDLTGTANDLTIGGSTTSIAYNAASQITSAPRSNSAYSYAAYANVSHAFGINALNQISTNSDGSTTKNFSYDANGNLTSDGANSYGYSSENLLTSAPGATLGYDPLTRLYQVTASSTTRFAYDGLAMLAEYDGNNALQDRYVFAPGMDQPIVWYNGSTVDSTTRRFLSSDERGSIISVTDSSGALVGINTYDEFGIPGSANIGRFQYTGQAWLPELGMYYYKARVYSPTLGRFMQTDPLGYGGDGPNLYAYVLNDPVNATDPTGTMTLEGGWSCYGPGCAAAAEANGPNNQYVNGFEFGQWINTGGSVDPGYGPPTNGVPVIISNSTWTWVPNQFNGFSDPWVNSRFPTFENVARTLVQGLGDKIKSAFCAVPRVSVSVGFDGYAIAGGSLEGSFELDLSRGRVGIGGGAGVGLGLAAETGLSVGGSLSHMDGGISANLSTTVGGGSGIGGSWTHNWLGTDVGTNSVSAGKFGGGVYANAGANVGASTPQLYDLGCGH